MGLNQQKYSILYVVFATLETTLFGGLFLGWSDLVYILKGEGVYQNLCIGNDSSHQELSNLSDQNVIINSKKIIEQDCIAREEMFSYVFSMDSGCLDICIAIQCLFNLRFGTRKTRIITHVQFICGAIMIAFTSKEIPGLIFPGLLLIGLSGNFHMITNCQFAFLFPMNSFVVTGVLSSAFASSAGVVQIVKIAYESGVSHQVSFVVIIAVYSLSFINTFFFLPKMFILGPTEDKLTDKPKEYGTITIDVTNNNTQKHNPSHKQSSSDESTNESKQSLKTFVFSATYITHIIWYSLISLRYYFYFNIFNLKLEHIFENDKDKASYYTIIFPYVQMTGFLISPLAGSLYAKTKQKYSKCESELHRRLMPNVLPILTTSLLCMLVAALDLFDSEWLLYVNFFVFSVFRAFFFTVGIGFLNDFCPPKYFGPLYGVMSLFSGSFLWLQYGFFKWVENAGLLQVHQAMLAITSLSLVHPLSQWIRVYCSEIYQVS